MDSVQITYVGTEQDFIDAQRTHAWRRYSPKWARIQKRAEPIFGVAFIASGVLGYLWHVGTGASLFVFVVGIYSILITPVIAPWFYKRAYRRSQTGESHETFLTITEERLVCDCPGHSHLVLEWNLIKGMIESSTTLFLYISRARFLYVPLRVLSSQQHAELKALLREKNIPYGCPKPVKG